MAYDVEKLAKVGHLKALAEKISAKYATQEKVSEVENKVNDLVTAGGEPNVITAVKVNGTALAITDKAVDVTIPTKVSELTNDQKFMTETDVAESVAAIDHLKRKKVESVEAIDIEAEDADQYIYMVPKEGGKNGDKYDEYMVLDGALEPVGDWAVDLSNYVQKEEGKGLSTNDFTAEDKAKLDAISTAATKVEAGDDPGTIKVDGEKVIVVDIATDAEVSNMLDEIFA